MSKYQWRILVNGLPAAGNDSFPAMPTEQWEKAVATAEQRGLKVTLERRHIWEPADTEAAGESLAELDPASYTRLRNGYTIFKWEVFAEYDDKNPMKIAAMIGGE